jgi:hypothetical protein
MHLLPRRRHPRNLNDVSPCHPKRPKNQISIAATQAQPESTAELPAKRRKLNPDNPAVPANSTGSIPSKPAKESHPLIISAREAAHTIQEKGKLREPGPCYQCLHRRKSKGSEFPTCMVAVDGKGEKMRMVHSPEAVMHRREAAVLDKEVPGQGQWREPGRA